MSTIYQRGDWWWISYYTDRKRIQYSLKVKDRRLAEVKQKKIDLELAQGSAGLPVKTLIAKAFQSYKDYSLSRKRSATWKGNNADLERFLSWSKAKCLQDIHAPHINDFLQKLAKEGRSPKTLNNYRTTISTFFKYCRQQKYISENPALDVARFKVNEHLVRFFTTQEIKQLLEVLQGNHLHPIVMTALYTGARINELIHLEWSDFDWNEGVVKIQNKPGWQTKSGRPRVIPLVSKLIEYLKPQSRPSGYCFLYKGKPIENNPERILARYLKKAGIINASWHTCRKTFASYAVMRGVSITKVAYWLGHSDPRLTYRSYAHLAPKNDHDIEKIDFDLL